MKFITENAEQEAIKYIKTFKKHTIYSRVAFFKLENTDHAGSGQRSLIKNFFKLEVQDPKTIIFQFMNGDIMVLSEKLTNNHVFKFNRYFDLDRYDTGRLYKIPKNYSDVAEELSRYMEALHDETKRRVRSGEAMTIREKFLGVDISNDLMMMLEKTRAEREDITVLVIDDDDFAARLVQKAVGHSHAIDRANTAIDGFKKYARIAPDITFLDINMPNISGHDFLQKIFDLDPQAYVVMLSGHDDTKNVDRAMELGAKGFVSKPFSKEDIHGYISQYTVLPQDVMQ